MKKPTKKGFLVGKNTGDKNWEISVCNKSCDEWEAFLPGEDEILKIIIDVSGTFTGYLSLAKEIARRIGK